MAQREEYMSEYSKWSDAEYPYDWAECGKCVAMHADGDCQDPAHEEFSRVAKKVLPYYWFDALFDEGEMVREKFTNLRELFRDFYPQQPVETPVEQPFEFETELIEP
jgi:hypothetical protein